MTRDQIFWSVVGTIGAALVGCAVFWGGSVRANVKEETLRANALSNQLAQLSTLKNKIPNEKTIEEWDRYQKWVAAQCAKVVDFYQRHDHALDKKLVRGIEEPDPGNFKAEYNSLRSLAVGHLKSNREMRVWNPEAVFLEYPWSIGTTNPDPADYEAIRKDFRIRQYLVLNILPRSGVKQLDNLSLYKPERIPGTEFQAVPVRVQCNLSAENIMTLLRSLLLVPERATDKPLVIMRECTAKKGPGTGKPEASPISLDLLMDFVDFAPESN